MAGRRQSGRTLALAVGWSLFLDACSEGMGPSDDPSPTVEVEKRSDHDFERANAIEEALVADYGREIVVSVSVSGDRVKGNATKVVSKDVLGEGLALELLPRGLCSRSGPGGRGPRGEFYRYGGPLQRVDRRQTRMTSGQVCRGDSPRGFPRRTSALFV